MSEREEATGRSTEEADLTQELADAKVLLLSVRRSLAAMMRAAQDGDENALRAVAGKQGQLEDALRRAFEIERKYHDWTARTAGHAAAGEIDLDAARHQIGCRLARIRACCHED